MTTDPLTVTRTLALKGADAAAVIATLKERGGVHDAHAAGDGVRVTYDLRHARLADIERLAEAAGMPPARGMLASLRRTWIAFTEENKLASVRAKVSPCCSRPPK